MSEKPVIEPRRKGRTGTQTMLIPSEAMVAAKLRAAPAGQLSDLGGLRNGSRKSSEHRPNRSNAAGRRFNPVGTC